nr:iron chelate uptake ABC transporter family permease subunit [Candidatus Frankia nodulisporulans]
MNTRFTVDRRSATCCVVLLAVALAVGAYTLTVGELRIPLVDVLRSLAGGGPPADAFIVRDLRLPRVLCALLAGAAFGASGALFQSLTRNSLGSPDVIGFETGAAAGALTVVVLLHGGAAQATLGAVAGGLATAVAVYLLALRGGATPHRLILMGIGMNTMLVSFTAWIVAHADQQDALAAQAWRIGSLGERAWSDVYAVALPLAVALPAALLLSRSLNLLAMGDDLAASLGVPVARRRLLLIAVGVLLAAAGTAAAGPVAFVALRRTPADPPPDPLTRRRRARLGLRGSTAAGRRGPRRPAPVRPHPDPRRRRHRCPRWPLPRLAPRPRIHLPPPAPHPPPPPRPPRLTRAFRASPCFPRFPALPQVLRASP